MFSHINIYILSLSLYICVCPIKCTQVVAPTFIVTPTFVSSTGKSLPKDDDDNDSAYVTQPLKLRASSVSTTEGRCCVPIQRSKKVGVGNPGGVGCV